MRYAAAFASLCFLAACEAGPAEPPDAARALVEAGNMTLKIFVRGRGEVKHTADLSGATSCSTLAPNPENADCVRTFAPNTVVTLQATAGAGFTFDHWGGKCTGTATCTLTMNESRTLEVKFGT